MLNNGPYKPFLFVSYIGNNENLPITDKIDWSLDIRYSEVILASETVTRGLTVLQSDIPDASVAFQS